MLALGMDMKNLAGLDNKLHVVNTQTGQCWEAGHGSGMSLPMTRNGRSCCPTTNWFKFAALGGVERSRTGRLPSCMTVLTL